MPISLGSACANEDRSSFSPRAAWTVAAALLCTFAFTACTGKPEPRRVAASTVSADTTPRAPAPGDPACPRDGLWKGCALVDRIVHSGFVFKQGGDTVKVAYLKANGIRYQVGSSTTLLAFFYTDTAALARDWMRIDTLHLTTPGDTVGSWPSPPDVMRSANLIAAFFSGDPLKRERVRLAITAGAPQAPRTAPIPTLPVQTVR